MYMEKMGEFNLKKYSYAKILISTLIISGLFAAGYKCLRVSRPKDKPIILGKVHEDYVKIPDSVYKQAAFLVQKERMSKGGVIGTDGKGVVALRFDDYQNLFREKIYPMLVDRGLPCSMSLISRFTTAQRWSKGTTWDDVRDWNENGVEIWSHGTDHEDYCRYGYQGLYTQIVTSKKEIEAHDIKVAGWTLPGDEATTKYIPYNGLTKPSDFNSEVGILLLKTYALSEAYAYKPQRILPTHIYQGLDHITVSDGSGETLASAEKAINEAIKNKTGIEIMCHAGNLGKPGNMTFSQYAALLDYIKAKWDDGSLEVLTPSGLYFADPNSGHRLELAADGSFEGLTAADKGAWKDTKNWSGKTIEKTGGRTGKNFLRISRHCTNSPVTQKITSIDKLKVSGEQFVFQGWYRASGKGSTNGVVQINDDNKTKRLNIMRRVIANRSSWKMERFVFGVPTVTKKITLSLYRTAGTGIDWDDISIKVI